MGEGRSVILDGTWRDDRQRQRARRLATESHSPIVEFSCDVALERATERIRGRGPTTSDATPGIAAAFADGGQGWGQAHRINTARPLTDTVAETLEIYRRTI